jgi:putative metallohydrolase (TIGR04338 family)
MKRPRDSQRSKCYEAEEKVSRGDVYTSLAQIKQYLARIFATQWLKKRYPEAMRFEVRDGRSHRRAKGSGRDNTCFLNLPRDFRYQLIILHELAHGLCQLRYGRTVAGHGREFCAIYYSLVVRFMGRDAGAALAAAFREQRVKFRLRRNAKPMTPERRAVVCERLARARQMAHAGHRVKQQQRLRAAQVLVDERTHLHTEPNVVVRVRKITFEGMLSYKIWWTKEKELRLYGAQGCSKRSMVVWAEYYEAELAKITNPGDPAGNLDREGYFLGPDD